MVETTVINNPNLPRTKHHHVVQEKEPLSGILLGVLEESVSRNLVEITVASCQPGSLILDFPFH
jgi:hypothetical protein